MSEGWFDINRWAIIVDPTVKCVTKNLDVFKHIIGISIIPQDDWIPCYGCRFSPRGVRDVDDVVKNRDVFISTNRSLTLQINPGVVPIDQIITDRDIMTNPSGVKIYPHASEIDFPGFEDIPCGGVNRVIINSSPVTSGFDVNIFHMTPYYCISMDREIGISR